VNVDAILVAVPPLAVYVVVGLVVGLESMGIPLPGEVVLVSAALLSSQQELNVSPQGVALAAAAGAVIGDSVGFAVGRRFGDRLFAFLGRHFPRHVDDAHVSWAEHVFTRYGVLAVFFGRFIALLRIFAGPLAGALRMPYQRFLAANVLGALFWAGGTTFLIYSLGTLAERWLQRSAWVALGVTVVVGVLASRLMHHRIERAVEAHAAELAAEMPRPAPGDAPPPAG
jgi:membrane protein DedA with SNARE-associated domain